MQRPDRLLTMLVGGMVGIIMIVFMSGIQLTPDGAQAGNSEPAKATKGTEHDQDNHEISVGDIPISSVETRNVSSGIKAGAERLGSCTTLKDMIEGKPSCSIYKHCECVLVNNQVMCRGCK